MNDFYRFVTDWSMIAAVGFLGCFGLGALAMDAATHFRQWLWAGRPGPPKPLPYRVTVETDDGWPLRSFNIPPEEAGRLVKNLESQTRA